MSKETKKKCFNSEQVMEIIKWAWSEGFKEGVVSADPEVKRGEINGAIREKMA